MPARLDFTRKGTLAAAVVAASVMLSGPASAAISLDFFINGTNVLTVVDGDGNDANGFADEVAFNGILSSGGTSIRINTSFGAQQSNLLTGVGSLVEDLRITAEPNTSAGDEIRVVATAPDISLPAGTGERFADSTITPDRLENFQLDYLTTVDGDTVLDVTAVPQSPPGAPTASIVAVNVGSNPFTIVHDATYTALANVATGDRGSFDSSTRVTVPVPATFGMLGVALFGLGVAMRRRRT
jgi:hypothetical protein